MTTSQDFALTFNKNPSAGGGFIYGRNTDMTACIGTLLSLEFKESRSRGTWVAQLVKRLPLAQVTILESQDQAPHRAPC